MSFVNNYLKTVIKTSWSSSACKEKKNTTYPSKLWEEAYLYMAWEVSMAYFRVRSLCDVMTKKYGHQESLPTQKQSFLMPKEVLKLIEDQDDNFVLREEVHKENF
jgi:hypothetical protein